MFNPKLGISPLRIDTQLNSEDLEILYNSNVSTLEIAATLFKNKEDREAKIDLIKKWINPGKLSVASIHAPFDFDCDISSLDDTIYNRGLSAILDSIDIAKKLNASIVVLHSSLEPIVPEKRLQNFNKSKEAINKISKYGEKNGIKIAVEFLPRSCIGNCIEELLILIEDCNPKYTGICIDTNHLMGNPHKLASYIIALKEKLITLHISDYDGIDEKHLLPGLGVINWKKFLDALNSINYTGPFNYECYIEGNSFCERISELEKNFEWMQTMLLQKN
jgi:hexosaminidase